MFSSRTPSREEREGLCRSGYPQVQAALRQAHADYFDYHNWAHHVEPARQKAADYLKRLELRGVVGLPLPVALDTAMDGHDSGMPIFWGFEKSARYRRERFTYPEALSIQMTSDLVNRHGYDIHTRHEVKSSQKPTKAGVKINSWCGMIAVMSDLFTATDTYDVFEAEHPPLLAEKRMTDEPDLEMPEFQDKVVSLMSIYRVKNILGATDFSRDINPLEFFAAEIDHLESNTVDLATMRAEANHESLEAYANRRGGSVMAGLGFIEAA